MCSWVGVQGADKKAVLDSLGLVETARNADPGSGVASFTHAELPDDWLIIFSEDFDWAIRERLLELSRFGLAVACQFEDKVDMESVASAARDGVELWRVYHKNDVYGRLDVSGEPPAAFAAIRDQLLQEQEANGGEGSSTDYLHDIPLELAKAVCGFRADETEDAFVALERVGGATPEKTTKAPPPSSAQAPKRGFFARLFGR